MEVTFNLVSELLPHQPDGFLKYFFLHVYHCPDKTAIITSEKTVTYHELATQAERLAQALRSKGVTHETPVAILLSPGIEQIISQLGILIAKGSCVPLDPTMPEERLNDMLDDLSVQWTIASTPDKHQYLHTTLLDFHRLLLNPERAGKRDDDISRTHRTHVLFTSGTTGKPKAVEIEAKGILRLVVNTRYINITTDDRIACIANPTFDASLFEVWGALLNGATTVVIPKNDLLNIHYFQEILVRQQITIMFITASLFNLIATTAPCTFRFIRHLLVGGEALNPHALKLVMDTAPPVHLINGYGPTESTTFALTHNIQPEDLTSVNVPIGQPVDCTFARILDDDLVPVDQGITGHLYLGGDGLARGYWNRDELNKEKFINVVLPGDTKPQRLYKTGDLCSQRPDDIFMYHGRSDNQIKLRGHRIELGEIECQILKSGQVNAATVALVKNEHAASFLAAFVVPQNKGSFRADELSQQLRQYLPEYMLPRIFAVNHIPLTPTGKTDKRQLMAQLNESAVHTERPEAFNDTEYALWLIWRNILNNIHISLDDNFFQLGGNSLQAASLVIAVDRQFSRHFSIQTLYDAPTLRELARVISQKDVIRTQDDVAQWLQDARLPEDIQPLSQGPQNWSELSDATVLLTGVTGFLGAYFLRDLLALPNIKKVICLVRATDEAVARLRIEDNLSQYGLWSSRYNERISVVVGDLSLPALGLTDERYRHLSTEVDVIFHLGAHVNYIQPYQAHRAGNIEGTLNILRLATQGKTKPLHYASTIAVFGPAGLLKKKRRIYENDDLRLYLECMKYDSGYSQSQWVVEQFMQEAKNRGILLSIYRPGFIMGDSINGAGNPKDFVSRLICGCIATGAYPLLPRQRKEFVPVDYVSAALLTIAKDDRNLGQIYHLVPPQSAQSLDLNQFFELLGECGYPLQPLPYAEWVTTLGNDPHLYDNPLMPLLPMLSEPVYQNQTRWEVYENMPAYDASNTQAALSAAKSLLQFTVMDKKQLSQHLTFWQKKGFLPDKKM